MRAVLSSILGVVSGLSAHHVADGLIQAPQAEAQAFAVLAGIAVAAFYTNVTAPEATEEE